MLSLQSPTLSALLSCAAFALLTSCVTAPTPEQDAQCMEMLRLAEGVRITSNPEAVRGCQFLDNITAKTWREEGTERMFMDPEDRCILRGSGSRHQAVDVARRAAARKGGDVVYTATTGDEFTGEIYRCDASLSTP
jgi:hypothetical protein